MGLFDWLFGRRQQPASPHGSAGGGSPLAQSESGPIARAVEAISDEVLGDRYYSKQPITGSRSSKVDIDLMRSYWGKRAPFWRQWRNCKPESWADGGPSSERVSALGLPWFGSREELSAALGVSFNDLMQYTIRPNRPNQHYVAHYLAKKSGGRRLVLAPKPRLKALQRHLLELVVAKLPLHDCVHGFRKARGCLSAASIHVGRDVVICLDIADFFPSFDFRRVAGFLRCVGYEPDVATAMAALTTVTPDDVPGATTDRGRDLPLLPQGAPTSPGLANAICWRMDKRLSALARKFGGDYTRYADDLTFSGGEDLARHSDNLVKLVRKIVQTEGLELNEQKTRVMRKGRQQRVTGVVVNEKTNLSRRDFDKLKAILHNCVKHGPAGQNRENHPDFKGHLQGRVAHAMHIGPERGAKLKALFDKIVW